MLLNRHMRRRAAALGRKSQTSNTTTRRPQNSALVTGSIAAGALMLATSSVAFAQSMVPGGPLGPCVISGTTATCTGDVSAGVEANDPLDTLNVNNLTQAIAPAAGIDGIRFYRAGGGDITVNADTGTYGIITTPGSDGIDTVTNGNGDISVTNKGDIDAGYRGIRSLVFFGNGNIEISSEGNIDAEATAIDAYIDNGDGDITIMSTGDITSQNDEGIAAYVYQGIGNVSITSVGDVMAFRTGIRARVGYGSDTGSINVMSTGNITSEDSDGIYASMRYVGGDINITSNGNIMAYATGIEVESYRSDAYGDGDITIMSTGNITSVDRDGIYASVRYGEGSISITSDGHIVAENDGIRAQSQYGNGDSNITIMSTGNITSEDRDGIDVQLRFGAGDISITSAGNIMAARRGIYASTYQSASYDDGEGDITIMSTGNITAEDRGGIEARIGYGLGDISVTSEGHIMAFDDGIRAEAYRGYGAANITIMSTGDITSVDSAGIYTRQYYNYGDVSITSQGHIVAYGTGIRARSLRGYGNSDIKIMSTGNITSQDDAGFRATIGYSDGSISITSVGDIMSYRDGINARGYGSFGSTYSNSIKIMSTGNITSEDGRGIDAYVGHGDGEISITSVGDIMANNDGIDAEIYQADGNITIMSTGNITSKTGEGIHAYAYSGSGDLSIMSTGNVTSEGRNAIQAYARSWYGDVSITTTGNITANDANRHAILTKVDPGYQSTINILEGTIEGGDGTGTGINLLSNVGATNIINVYGPVTISSLGGTAIEGGAGDTTINNWGTLNTVTNGEIFLGAGGTNAFNNFAGGIFHSGAIVDLGAGNLFDNHGTLSPGGDGNILTTELTGDFNQTDSGILMTDVDMGAANSDLLDVLAMGTAELSGNVRVQVSNPAFNAGDVTILSADGGTTDNGLGVIASPALQAELSFPNANDVVLSTDLDFTAPGAELNDNQTSVAETVSSALGAGGGALDPVILALLNGPTDNPGYQMALDQLGGESFLNEDNAALFGAEAFGGQMFSCQVNGEQYAAISEGSCLWVRPIQGYTFDRDGTASSVGFDGEAFGTSVGGQTEFSPDWFAGIALGFEHGDLTTDTGVVSDRESYNAGLSLKHTMGAFAVSGAVFAGTSHFDTMRTIAIGGLTATNMSSHNVTSFGARARGAYLHEFGGGAFIKPMVDFSLVHLDRGGFSETGNAATALTIAGSSDTYFSATPAVEFGIDHQTKENQIVRFYGKAGVAIYADDGHSLSGSFTNAPAGTAGFVSNTEFDNVFAEVEAGFTFMDDGAATIQLGFQGRYSENSAQSGGFIKANMEF